MVDCLLVSFFISSWNNVIYKTLVFHNTMLVIIMQSCWKKKLFKAWKRNINQRNRHLAYYIFFRKLCLNRLERYGENMYLILIKLNIENIKHIKYTQTHIQPTSSQRNTVIYTLQLLMIRGQIQEAHGLAVILSPLPHRKKRSILNVSSPYFYTLFSLSWGFKVHKYLQTHQSS